MEQRDRDRVREPVQDDLVDDVPPRADRVPAHTQQNDPDPFPNRGPVRRSHLPARSDESPAVCVSGCTGGRAGRREAAPPSEDAHCVRSEISK